jgi:hypothetical protein
VPRLSDLNPVGIAPLDDGRHGANLGARVQQEKGIELNPNCTRTAPKASEQTDEAA